MPLGTSDTNIYRQMNWGGELLNLTTKDMISLLKPIENLGFKWSIDSERLERPFARQNRFAMYETPWCHARHLPGKHCALDHQVTFNCFHIIHPRCMECWKTVLTPRTFDELMTWKKIQEQEIGFACKCGIEMRDYTPKFYGAYHYAHSLDEGRQQYEVVYKLAKKYLSDETAENVLLKRACTEYEMIKGNSSHWHLTERDERLLELIDVYVDLPFAVKTQPQFTKPHVMLKWALWAHMNGDFSYVSYNGGKKLFPDYQKYHEGNIDGLKHDLAICRAEAQGIPYELTEEFVMGTDEFARNHNITMDKLTYAMGNNVRTPLKTMDFKDIVRVDPDTIGEGEIQPESGLPDAEDIN